MDEYIKLFDDVRNASRKLYLLDEEKINEILLSLSKEMELNRDLILSENEKDLELMDSANPKYDRLLLNDIRLNDIIADILNVANIPSPLGQVIEEKTLPNKLKLSKISVPFGVIGIIFEARPNVITDVFSLCLKSGNACILKGGSDAYFSNTAITSIIKKVLEKHNINSDICTLLPNNKEAINQLLRANNYVDLIIPRGGKQLINFVRENATIPVIETGAGVCHTYFHKNGNIEKGKSIITNAKTRKVSVCNTLDCLIIDKESCKDLPTLCKDLATKNVSIFADTTAFNALHTHYPSEFLKHADENSFGIEFLDYKMAIKTVDNITDAIAHITKFGSKHSEAIISEDKEALRLFEMAVDAACIYTNASTAFTDGAQFGLGAEIGISTQKLHARGPMALKELCSYKWLISGDGQIRS